MRKPVLDHDHVLSVHRTVSGEGPRLLPGERRSSVTTWWYRNGQVAGRVGHVVEIADEDAGTLTLDYTVNGAPVRQVFALVARPCRFGGRRWFARCPRTGRLVAKLYRCCGTFQPRHLLHASYRSQDRVSSAERLRDREVAILKRLAADDHSRSYPKPKWMRWPTYGRLIRELRAVRGAYGVALAREFYLSTGIDLTDGEVPEVRTPRRDAVPLP